MLDPDGNRLLLADDLAENISVLRSLNPEVIWSPPSYLRLIAQTIVKWGITGIRPKILICGAEMLDADTRAFIESTFGVPIFNEYGTVDIASRAIAWECERHTGFHINMDAIFLECVDEQGEPVAPGEEGYIVATNLFRYATPMIRYRIGDVGIFSEQPCACGRQFPIIQSIVGRSDDFIVLSNGRWISPFSAMHVCYDVPGVKRYKIVQEEHDRIIIFLEPMHKGDDVKAAIRANCTILFGPQLHVEFVIGPIVHEQGKKIRTVTSKLAGSRTRVPVKK
jgi:phenylacetate-CoA ligase